MRSMSDAFWIAFFASLAPSLLALGALLSSIINGLRVKDLHERVNGRLDQLIVATGQVSEAKGREDERVSRKEHLFSEAKGREQERTKDSSADRGAAP